MEINAGEMVDVAILVHCCMDKRMLHQVVIKSVGKFSKAGEVMCHIWI